MRTDETIPETFDHVAVGSPEEEGLVFSFSWLAPDAPLEVYDLPYVQAIARVREALRAAPASLT